MFVCVSVLTLWCLADIAELKQKIHMLNLLVLLLPEPNRNTLKVITQARASVHAHTHHNARQTHQHLHAVK